MARVDAALLPLVSDIERALRELGVPYAVVGALVPELLLEARPPRMTNDADITVVVQSLSEFEGLKDQLARYGFERTRLAYRLRHRSCGILDVLPYSETLAPDDRLQLADDLVFNLAGFRHVVPKAVPTTIDDGPTLPLAPLPLYALLKLIAFSDRGAPKDLGGVLHCLEHYLEDDDRRYEVEWDGAGVPFDYTCAHLLGLDARPLLDPSISKAVRAVLDRFGDADAHVVGLAAAERGRLWADDDRRSYVFELFRWYRLGTGL